MKPVGVELPRRTLFATKPAVTNVVTNKPKPVKAASSTDVERVARWRAENRDRYNSKQRDLMRRKRAAAKD